MLKIGKFMKLIVPLLFLSSILNAQNIVFTASCDQTQIALGETFTLEIKVGGDISNPPNPELPSMTNFDVVSTSRMQSISIVNGKSSSEISFNHTLAPRKIGKFTIGSCTMKYKGQIFKTHPIEIKVVKSTSNKNNQKQASLSVGKGKEGKNLFATLTASKTKAYVNDQIILSFKFYQSIQLLSSPQYTPPSFSGFWKEDLGETREYKIINGKKYLINEIRYAIFPTSSGVYTIGPVSMKCQVENRTRDFFSFSFGGKTKTIKTNPVKIKVLDLPTKGKPSNFSGAVGQFRFSAKFDNTKVHQHKPITLLLTISGTGNIKSIEAPELPNLPDFKIYNSGSKINSTNTKNNTSGEKIFSIILVPEREGKFEIPGIVFNYFDSKAGKYKTLTTSPQPLTVLAGSKTETYVSAPGNPIEILGKDIHYIKTKIKLTNEDNYIYKNRLFLIIQFIPILVLLISLKYAKQKEKLMKNKAYARAIKVDKLTKKRLLQCNKLLAQEEPEKFYEETYRTLTEYIGGKLNIPEPSLTIDMAIKRLKEKGIKEETLNKFKNLFTTCDLAKFGLGNLKFQDIKTSYKELSSLISELSKKL